MHWHVTWALDMLNVGCGLLRQAVGGGDGWFKSKWIKLTNT